MKKAFLLLLFSCFIQDVFSQNIPDSIITMINNPSLTDSAKASNLNKYSEVFRRSNPELELKLIEKATTYFEVLDHTSKGLIYTNYGVHYLYKGEYSKTDSLLQLAIQHCKTSGDAHCTALTFSELGNLNYYQENDSLALSYWLKSAEVYESLKDQYRLARLYNNISMVYDIINDHSKSFEYLKKSVRMKEQIGDDRGLGSGYHNLGRNYYLRQQRDSANFYFVKAKNIRLKFNDKKGLAVTYGTMGHNFKDQNLKDSALFYIEHALKLDRELQDSLGIIQDMVGYVEILAHFGENEKLLQIGTPLLSSLERNKDKYLVYKSLSEAAGKSGKYQDAYNYLNQSVIYKDSIFTTERTQAIDELEKKYDSEKKGRQIAELEKKNRINELEAQQEKQWRYFLISISIALFTVLALIYNRYRLKNKSERLLAEKNEQLSELNKTKNRLFSIIAHDLKSPLSAFSMLVGALKENSGELSREELDEYLNTILDSSEDINKLLVNLLDWARIQSNNLVFNAQDNSIEETVQKAFEPLKLNARLKNIKFTNNASGLGYFDDIMIVTILRNLISNSIKFTLEGGEINVNSEEESEYSVITVKDTGVGISPEIQKNLFENKHLSSSSRNGTGLGLIISKDLVKKHNGRIKVISEEGKGTIFKIYLPKNTKKMMVA